MSVVCVLTALMAGCHPGERDCERQTSCFRGERCVAGTCVLMSIVADTGPAGDTDTNPDAATDVTLADCRTDTIACGALICDPTSGQCVPCQSNNECTGKKNATICEAGRCVQCTVAEPSACGEYSCNPATHLCTQTKVASRDSCETCVADSECSESADRCVPMYFNSNRLDAGYCLPLRNGSCDSEFAFTVNRQSLSGGSEQFFCAPNEQTTTCQAIDDRGKSCQENAQCGLRGIGDGLCKSIAGTRQCTYACDIDEDCPGPETCKGIYCGPP